MISSFYSFFYVYINVSCTQNARAHMRICMRYICYTSRIKVNSIEKMNKLKTFRDIEKLSHRNKSETVIAPAVTNDKKKVR